MVRKLHTPVKSKKSRGQTTKSFPSSTLNTLLTDLFGEKWKDIPGFEDEYQLSNFGRVKSLDRWVNKGKYDQFRPGRIIKQRLVSSQKKNIEVTVDLQMNLHKDKKRYALTVARYVYCLFVAPFDLEDHTLIVTRKDGNKLNCYYKNLLLRSISEVAEEGYATQKRTSPFQLQSKPVTQYNLNGKKIKRFENSQKATAATSISAEYINGAAKSMNRTAGGYFWRYGNSYPVISISKYKKSPDSSREGKNPRRQIPAKKSTYHYLNRDIKNIPGEKWKQLEGELNVYQVSNCGRMKSLSRIKEVTILSGNTARYWTREMIMKQNFVKYMTQSTGKTQRYLTINLKKGSIYTTYSIPRLVYQFFGRSKRALDTGRVRHKDGDYLNNHISNLRPPR